MSIILVHYLHQPGDSRKQLNHLLCREMNRFAIILAASLLAGCATSPPVDPFTTIPDGGVSTVLVGDIVCDTLESNPKKARFDAYFRIEDPATVAMLTELMRQGKSEPDFPFIGILSYQRFVDARGRPIADTHIVNFNNTVTRGVHQRDELEIQTTPSPEAGSDRLDAEMAFSSKSN